MSELPKTFDPGAIESRWYPYWEANNLFRPDRGDSEPFTIVIPPPNVTGSLHIGHALDNTLQDILIRHARLQGKDALWVVGTDHAGIATQMVVERTIAGQGLKRQDLGRDAFLDIVWDWKKTSGGAITRQLRRLGASCDWANERFTMDEGFSRAVVKVFVQLYREGLLYRDKRLVNWDPKFQTAISDLEVETKEVQGSFWHFRYPLADGSGHISVATTRPETMLADMAVAVNPEDERYKHLIGAMIAHPITGRQIPIVADEHADPELGSGAVKITPGHDFNDFDVGVRAGIKPADMLNMFNAEARIVQTADGRVPGELIGLDRVDARKRVVALIEEAGLLERVEDRVIQTPFGDRSGVVIEPWLTDQWYVDAKTLAGPAIEAVRSGTIKVVPESWTKTYYNWMENIQPWCVSRQLWWGHRIPAWYGPVQDPEIGWQIVHDQANSRNRPPVFVAEDFEQAKALAATHYGISPDLIEESPTSWKAVGYESDKIDEEDEGPAFVISEAPTDRTKLRLWRDSDVLDTWFSSALWPFGTLGWPDASPLPLAGGAGGGQSLTSGTESNAIPTPNPSRELEGNLLARHYPNDVLISGFDILFFWDARMIMQGLHFMKEVPFKTLYLHGLVRAPDGSKMSKSKGNTVDPLGLIDKYGADALRFTLAAMESQGRDIKLDERRVEGYRNFATKLWNATRFAQANGIGASMSLEPPAATLPVNRWIVGETIKTVQRLDLALADLRYDEAANTIYQFVWSQFCDWYLELIKPVLSKASPSPSGEGTGVGPVSSAALDQPHPNPSPEGEGLETRAVAAWVLDQILVMLHPFMPFITEELWHAMGERPYDLIVAKWPVADARAIDPEAGREVEWLIQLVKDIRATRSEFNLPPSQVSTLHYGDANVERRTLLFKYANVLKRLARVNPMQMSPPDVQIPDGPAMSDLESSNELMAQSTRIQIVSGDSTYFLYVGEDFDLGAERARLSKAIAAAEKERDSLAGRLSNPSFVERAKPEAVEKARADHAEKSAEAERLTAALGRLG